MSATKPNDYLSVVVNKEPQEVFMSGGLVRRLSAYMGNLQDFSAVFGDAELQNLLVVEALRPRNKRGETAQEYTIEDFELSTEDTTKLVMWITEHALHFFVQSLQSAKELGDNNKDLTEVLQKLMQSGNGSEASVESTQSAGPSTSSQAN